MHDVHKDVPPAGCAGGGGAGTDVARLKAELDDLQRERRTVRVC
jgi:hypothetical protein